LSTAQTSVRFRVRSRNDKINSVFHSVSDLLVTNHERTALKRFDKDETFLPTDIFTEMIIDYDKEFWGDFNIIQPDDDLRKALKDINTKGGMIKNDTSKPDQKLQTK
jgi:Holliday junction resolvase RusA-like endonuclease